MKTLRSFVSTLVFLVLCLSLPDTILGHGRLWEPCGRNTLWRVQPNNPAVKPDYNDMEKNCGGFSTQVANGDKCGCCGDPYNQAKARDSENGGTFGAGVIAATYVAGNFYPFTCEFTATHMGYYGYEYYVLPNSTSCEEDEPEKWTPLLFEDGNATKELPPNAPTRKYTDNVQIPAGLVADRCVIRWTYVSGNSWGTCEDGTGGMGCGPQETFRGCSDVKIVPPSVPPPPSPDAEKHKQKRSKALGV